MRFLALAVLMSAFVSPATAADVEPSDIAEIVGVWKLDLTTPDGEKKTPIVIVGFQVDEFVAWHLADGIDDKQVESIKKVEIVGEALHLSFRPQEHNGQVAVTLKAELESDGKCSGEIDYKADDGTVGSIDFNGKRLGNDDFDGAEDWKLSFVDPNGKNHKPTVTVVQHGEHLHAWYSSEGYELPADNVTISENESTMTVTTKTPEGEDIKVTFTGTVDGDSVAGDVEVDLGGEVLSFPFTGKRVEE